ncbi:flavodoxin family protein [Telmatobacter bradus]|uniref:flavodoxin family protein n=1 Tax=Telmatobacter bradus TaxID=474953 RepID=UPI003B439A4B
MGARIVAVVGSYRREGTVEAAVEAVLAAAREKGAITQTIHLTEELLEFCTNCRACTQTPGEERGKCQKQDGLEAILSAIEAADAVVLASPVNYWNVTAIFRRFMERLLGFAYWPWGQMSPKLRVQRKPRKAVLIAAAGMPGFLIPVATGASRALKITAAMLGAAPVGRMWIGLAAATPHQPLAASSLRQARKLGWKLAA